MQSMHIHLDKQSRRSMHIHIDKSVNESMHTHNIRISQCDQCIHIISELVNAINADIYRQISQCDQRIHISMNQSMQSMNTHIDESINAINAYTY